MALPAQSWGRCKAPDEGPLRPQRGVGGRDKQDPAGRSRAHDTPCLAQADQKVRQHWDVALESSPGTLLSSTRAETCPITWLREFSVKGLREKLHRPMAPTDQEPVLWHSGASLGVTGVTRWDSGAQTGPADVLPTHLEKVRETFSE